LQCAFFKDEQGICGVAITIQSHFLQIYINWQREGSLEHDPYADSVRSFYAEYTSAQINLKLVIEYFVKNDF
jgi:hypothetical protein